MKIIGFNVIQLKNQWFQGNKMFDWFKRLFGEGKIKRMKIDGVYGTSDKHITYQWYNF